MNSDTSTQKFPESDDLWKLSIIWLQARDRLLDDHVNMTFLGSSTEVLIAESIRILLASFLREHKNTGWKKALLLEILDEMNPKILVLRNR
ncbi:hypothetical protein HG530_001818 [Fusarium avenaceum]|nr:hypothetical protein HG530_001818 [Fusarium avenaceum]